MNDLVEGIFDAGEVHLVNGPSNVGKTTWLAQFLRDFQSGRTLWGKIVRPQPWIYISFDRSGKQAVKIFDKVGLKYTEDQVVLADDIPGVTLQYLQRIVKSEHKLIVIEALASVFEDGRAINDYIKVRNKIAEIKRWIRPNEQTIIATAHDAKVREGKEIKNARERMLGSAGWGAFCSTIVSLEVPSTKLPDDLSAAKKDPRRIVTIDPKGSEAIIQTMRFNEKGQLMSHVEIESIKDDAELESLPDEFTREWLAQLVAAIGRPPSTVDNWLRKWKKAGRLEAVGNGSYRKVVFF